MVPSELGPTLDVLGPVSPPPIELGRDETRDELVHWAVIRNISGFHIVMIEGHGYIPRISYDVDHLWIMRLKAFVTLQNARTHQSPHAMIGVEVNFGDPALNVQESDGLILVDQVSDEKTSPSISGTRIRREENVVRENREVAPGHLMARHDSCDLAEAATDLRKMM